MTSRYLWPVQLMPGKEDIVLYVGSLCSLSYPEVERVGPEFWKSRLQQAIQAILALLIFYTKAD